MSDKYGDRNFDLVPRGPFKGRPWVEVPALTLHSILNGVDFGLIEIDERRVVAIRAGLRAKDHPSREATGGKPIGEEGAAR